MDVVRPAVDAKQIRLVSALDPAAGPVSGDADRLQQIVWNLLSNAVKFTPAGGQIGVRLEREGANVTITVSDTGEGIEPEFLPFVFDRFRQFESGPARASWRSRSGVGDRAPSGGVARRNSQRRQSRKGAGRDLYRDASAGGPPRGVERGRARPSGGRRRNSAKPAPRRPISFVTCVCSWWMTSRMRAIYSA